MGWNIARAAISITGLRIRIVPRGSASIACRPTFKGSWQRMENFSVTTALSKA